MRSYVLSVGVLLLEHYADGVLHCELVSLNRERQRSGRPIDEELARLSRLDICLERQIVIDLSRVGANAP